MDIRCKSMTRQDVTHKDDGGKNSWHVTSLRTPWFWVDCAGTVWTAARRPGRWCWWHPGLNHLHTPGCDTLEGTKTKEDVFCSCHILSGLYQFHYILSEVSKTLFFIIFFYWDCILKNIINFNSWNEKYVILSSTLTSGITCLENDFVSKWTICYNVIKAETRGIPLWFTGSLATYAT